MPEILRHCHRARGIRQGAAAKLRHPAPRPRKIVCFGVVSGAGAAGMGGYLPGGVGADGERGGVMRGNRPPAVARLPRSPGVYRFRDAADRVLYVGRQTAVPASRSSKSWYARCRDWAHNPRTVWHGTAWRAPGATGASNRQAPTVSLGVTAEGSNLILAHRHYGR